LLAAHSKHKFRIFCFKPTETLGFSPNIKLRQNFIKLHQNFITPPFFHHPGFWDYDRDVLQFLIFSSKFHQKKSSKFHHLGGGLPPPSHALYTALSRHHMR